MIKKNNPSSGCIADYMPANATKWLQDRVRSINKQLSTLQEYVTAHNEDWQDVLTYIANGYNYKVEDRKKECLEWLKAANAPAYVWEDYISKAIADLGEDNLEYWKGLAPLLRVYDNCSSGAALINLSQDVDTTSGVWRIKQEWQSEKLKGYRVVVSPQMAQDFEAFKQAAEVLSDLARRDYDLSEALQAILNGQNLEDYNLEWFDGSWIDENTKKNFAEFHQRQISASLRTSATPCEDEITTDDFWY